MGEGLGGWDGSGSGRGIFSLVDCYPTSTRVSFSDRSGQLCYAPCWIILLGTKAERCIDGLVWKPWVVCRKTLVFLLQEQRGRRTGLGGPETLRRNRRNEEPQRFREDGAATRDVGLGVLQ